MRIGIFLGYGPQTILGKEGLGRYFGTLIKGFQESGHEVVVSSPHWLFDSLDALFDDLSIRKSDVQWIATEKDPILWQIYRKFVLQKSRRRFLRYFLSVYQKAKKLLAWMQDRLAESDSAMYFFLILALAGAVLVASFPILVCFVLTYKLWRGLQKILEKGWRFFDSLMQSKAGKDWGFQKVLLPCFRKMEWAEQRRLVKAINKRKHSADIWFIPSLFWPLANEIESGIVVINAPDLIPEEFPVGFGDRGAVEISALRRVHRTLRDGTRFITYGDYIRQELLLGRYQKNPNDVISVNHANNDLMPYIQIDSSINIQNHTNKNYTEAYAKSFLGDYANTGYIFYSSQSRPNKNILNLVKAVEYLLRKKFLHIKLFLTASLDMYKPVGDYIREHQLEREVISFFNVPTTKLAALYYCAELVVNPTLYEGGFPFTFGEGMSVGTPSIMSDIPQIREVLAPAGLEDIMFDPYDWKAMADKIEYALAHKEELYQKELPLYQELAKRTWKDEAGDYVKAFQYFLAQEAAEKA